MSTRSFRLVCPPERIPQVEALLRAQGYDFAPEPFSPFCRRILHEPRPLGASLAAFFGYIYIQDRSSMLPPLALGLAAGESVLDVCASPGSKTGFLAQLAGPEGFVLANEPSPARLATLRANLHQCNLLQAATCSYSGDALPLSPASWRAILLDPPCSGWGTAEKHPRVLKLWQGDKLKTLVSLQQRLLRHCASLLAPGGRMVYSTCTTNEAENEAQVRFAEEELGLVRERLAPFPGFVCRNGPAGTVRCGWTVRVLRHRAFIWPCSASRRTPPCPKLRERPALQPAQIWAGAAAQKANGGADSRRRLHCGQKDKPFPVRPLPGRAVTRTPCPQGRSCCLANICALYRRRPPCSRPVWSGRVPCWDAVPAAGRQD